MKNDKFFWQVLILVLMSFLLAACGSTRGATFPTGKFIKSGEPALVFN